MGRLPISDPGLIALRRVAVVVILALLAVAVLEPRAADLGTIGLLLGGLWAVLGIRPTDDDTEG